MSINHRDLLVKFMAHMGEADGWGFLNGDPRDDEEGVSHWDDLLPQKVVSEGERWTPEEWAELQRLGEEALAFCEEARRKGR